MNSEEAKQILHAFRPESEDAEDALFSKALKRAEEDHDLADWFTQQKAFDEAMRKTLKQDSPPSYLRDSILAAGKGHGFSTPTEMADISILTQPNHAKKQNHRHLVRWVSAIAAIFVLLMTSGELFLWESRHYHPTEMTLNGFADAALSITKRGIYFGTTNHDSKALRSWLAHQGAPSEFNVPLGLKELQALGCQSYFFDSVKVSLICFRLREDQVAHLFVVEKSALKAPPMNAHPTILTKNGSSCVTWVSGNLCYILTGDDISIETLKELSALKLTSDRMGFSKIQVLHG